MKKTMLGKTGLEIPVIATFSINLYGIRLY